MSEKKYKWIIPEELPGPVVKRREEYDECLDEFLESGLASARVTIPGVKPVSVARLLATRIKKRGLKGKVMVSVRKGKVYLIRPDKL